MKKYWFKTLCLLCVVLLTSVLLVSCDDDDNDGDPRNGMIENRTPYAVRLNFSGIKIIEIAPNAIVRENALEEGKTYQIQATIFDNAGAVLEVVNSSTYIDKDADDRIVANQTCSWYIRIWGEAVPFTIESAS
ncbi:hypothetical protein U14_02943 [Candidatus Moduliflexus flocculans]|uniref:Uncharacterized protein n=1 Tax=Candidatus Moduliflexus flocculans TaxID=1499966 RepID=A0A081BMT2_9BACT|nr:hypothetical protein U14_02943 [Candidatus Moduliflexus flocculans]